MSCKMCALKINCNMVETQPLEQLYWYNPDSAISSFKGDKHTILLCNLWTFYPYIGLFEGFNHLALNCLLDCKNSVPHYCGRNFQL